MAELNAHIPTLCQNPEHVISFIENHAQVFQKTLGTSHDLASIMSSIRRWEVTAQQATQLNEIIKEKYDIVSTIIRDRMANIEHNYELAHQKSFNKKTTFKNSETYKQIEATKTLLHKLFWKWNFLWTGDYAFFSWAITNDPIQKKNIEALLQYDTLEPWWDRGNLPPNQRFGFKNKSKYILTKNESTGGINETKIGLTG